MLYQNWGFTSSPFQSTPLPSSALGRKLLVGRDAELEDIRLRLLNGTKMPTLEGLNGIGKTSIVNVAAYSLYQDHVSEGNIPLYLPCRTSFQLDPSVNLSEFAYKVFLEVAQTLVERQSDLTKTREKLDIPSLDRWLNQMQSTSVSAGIPYAQAGFARSNNETSGFERSGFQKAVESMLERAFRDGGAILCVIDNLELLQESATARRMMEALRDGLFSTPGLKWVLCGALGIVHGFATTPRLEGYLHDPIVVGEITPASAPEVLRSRIEAMASREDVYLPLVPDSFAKLFNILQGNLRSTLSYADDYCVSRANSVLLRSNDEKADAFQTWLESKANAAEHSATSAVSPRALQAFRDIVGLGGLFSPSQFADLTFNSIEALRSPIRELEQVGLLTSTRDDSDKRRKTIQITAKGWLIVHKMDTAEGAS